MRSGARTVATALAPATRTLRERRPARGLTVIGWHRVDGPRSDGLSTGIDDFRRHLDVLEEWGAQVVGLEEGMTQLGHGTLPERAVALTFDDGYASVVETAWPILHERSWPATLFVVSGFLTGELRFAWDSSEPATDRLRLVRSHELVDVVGSGLDVGSHTVTHGWLPHQTPDEQLRELCDSRQHLEHLIGRSVTSLAYPSGGWDPDVRRVAAEAGYRTGVTVDRGTNTVRTHPLSLRRAFVPESPTDLRLLLDGAYTFLRPLDAWRNRKGPAW